MTKKFQHLPTFQRKSCSAGAVLKKKLFYKLARFSELPSWLIPSWPWERRLWMDLLRWPFYGCTTLDNKTGIRLHTGSFCQKLSENGKKCLIIIHRHGNAFQSYDIVRRSWNLRKKSSIYFDIYSAFSSYKRSRRSFKILWHFWKIRTLNTSAYCKY